MTKPPHRRSYRHGNLRAALVEAGLENARAAGPDAVVLREATRRAGVAPNAAYRHFADRAGLLAAVREEAAALLAASMRAALRAAPPAETADAARVRLRAIGVAYVAFARREPGWFRTAFSGAEPEPAAPGTEAAPVGVEQFPPKGSSSPYGLLAEVLDDLVAAGCLPGSRRAGAEVSAWSSVHGLAMLLIAGPLQHLGDEDVSRAVEHLLEVVDRGLTDVPG